MKRLLQISLDTLLASILPILMWLVLGFIINKNISNIFSITYPLQFLYMIFITLFAVGPNITYKKEKNNNVVCSNMLFGCFFVGTITVILCLNVDNYIKLMNISKNIYHSFCIYSIVLIYYNFCLQLLIQKLYYEGKNKEANKISLLFNLTNFSSIIILSLLFGNIISIIVTLTIDFLILLNLFIKEFVKIKQFNFDLKLKKNIKYTSFVILRDIGHLIIYGIGFGNSFSYGEKYLNAINFEGLTTDAQWDMLYSIDTAAKIDLSKNNFNYKKSLKDAYKLLAILISSILIMNFTLYWYFKPNIKILLIILIVQIIDMLVEPLKAMRLNYIQINDNSSKHNIVYIISRFFRILCSFIPSAFCTYIGQIFSMIYLYIYSKIECRKVKLFMKNKDNLIIKKRNYNSRICDMWKKCIRKKI